MSHKFLYNSLKGIIKGLNFKAIGIIILRSIKIRLSRAISLLSLNKDLKLPLEELVQVITLYRSKTAKTTDWATKTQASLVEKQKSVPFQETIGLVGQM